MLTERKKVNRGLSYIARTPFLRPPIKTQLTLNGNHTMSLSTNENEKSHLTNPSTFALIWVWGDTEMNQSEESEK